MRVVTAPRARGDGPITPAETARTSTLLPAHAGMVPGSARGGAWDRAVPRARGDGPRFTSSSWVIGSCSPRTRGRSHMKHNVWLYFLRRPAHAGMVPAAP